MEFIFGMILGYLAGSISFGIIIAKRFKGIDIREYGSGNTGVTNVLRVVGKGPAAIVLVGDILKGVVGVALGLYLGSTALAVLGGMAAVIGHTYPAFYGFKGGKGVATGFGVLLTLSWEITLIALGIFALTILITRFVSVGSIVGALSVPTMMFILHKPQPLLLFGLIVPAFVIYNHRHNIIRLYQGIEPKVGRKI